MVTKSAAASDDSDHFENAVAMAPHFARSIAEEVQEASGNMSEWVVVATS